MDYPLTGGLLTNADYEIWHITGAYFRTALEVKIRIKSFGLRLCSGVSHRRTLHRLPVAY